MWIILSTALVAILFPQIKAESLIDCDFENETTLCGYTIEEDQTPGLFDVMQWRPGQALEKQQYYDIKLLAFGPDVDHTTETDKGIFMYAVRPVNPNTNTSLVSPVARGRLCYLEFFYHMGSRSLNTMNAYVIKYGERIKLWSVDGYQGRDWNRALIDIEKYTEFGNYQIAIEVTEPDDAYWTVGYAVDDVKGVGCNMPIDCDFEKDMCNLEVEQNSSLFDPMHWARGKSKTKTWFGEVDTIRFGPTVDHTTGNKNGHFVYALKTLATETVTGLVGPKQLDPLCHVSFWYYMNISTLTSLQFHVRDNSGDNLIWQASGAVGGEWQYVQLSIENMTYGGGYELVWYAYEPQDEYWTVGYAMDDIKTYKCSCDSNPCLNGGFCFNEFDNFTCHCPQYYEGQQCETNTNPCRNSPCKNLAICTPHDKDYTCSCWPGWTGKDCDADVDDCASSPCVRGTCVDSFNAFTCQCPPGWGGDDCGEEIDECLSGPCQYGATCIDGFNSYTCQCEPGFNGTRCQYNIDECASNPCQHGGVCLDEINKYVCICHPEYAGFNCEIREQIDCDFEKNFCGYHITTTDATHTNDTFEWVRGPVAKPGFFGSSRVLFMGPVVDHTTGEVSGNAAFAKRGVNKNATTSMLSAFMTGRLCYLEFFYHMGSGSLNDLNVFMHKDGQRNLIYTSNGYQGFDWQRAMVDIERFTETGKYQLEFEVDEPDATGFLNTGYAIDDIKGFNCDLSIDCDFENDTCNYIIERDDDFFDRMEWRRGQAVLETIFADIKLLRNGPSNDHTRNTSSGFFMYAVKPINSGTNTTLVAPRQRDPLCFVEFYYHMGSTFLNDLIVDIRGENETVRVFNVTGYQGDDWKRALINIEDVTRRLGKYEIAIFANEPSDKIWTVGYTIDDIKGSQCLCDNVPCQNNGTCIDTFMGYTCDCPYLYTGVHCETTLTPCDYAPCQNGGSCHNHRGKYKVKNGKSSSAAVDYACSCAPGWTGHNCETNINECESNPCLNFGICTDKVNGFDCACAPGFMGDTCAENINECLSNPCLNNAVCKDEINFFECQCQPGYFGAYCQFDIDECASQPCIHGGTCVDDVNFYSCQCLPGYTGQNCEIDIDECENSPCLNHGICMDRIARFDCYCRPGFTDSRCGTNVNECWSDPCHNNATCVDQINKYMCDCPPGYTGVHCETDIDECASSPCRNGGTCQNLIGKFHCDCPIHWTGEFCHKSLSNCDTDPC